MVAPSENLASSEFSAPAELEAEVEKIISYYPVSKRSAAMPILHLLQDRYGYVSEDAMIWAAEKLELQPINLLELVTFYPMYHEEQIGKTHIRVCRTLSCAMQGSYDVFKSVCRALRIDESKINHHHPVGVTWDKKYSVEFNECLASCGTAPVMMIGDDLFENVKAENIADLIKEAEAKRVNA